MASIVPVGPLLPGLAYSISGDPAVQVNDGILNLYTFDWLFGFVVSAILYTALSLLFPAKETLLAQTIWNLDGTEGEVITAQGSDVEKQSGNEAMEVADKTHPSDSKVL